MAILYNEIYRYLIVLLTGKCCLTITMRICYLNNIIRSKKMHSFRTSTCPPLHYVPMFSYYKQKIFDRAREINLYQYKDSGVATIYQRFKYRPILFLFELEQGYHSRPILLSPIRETNTTNRSHNPTYTKITGNKG